MLEVAEGCFLSTHVRGVYIAANYVNGHKVDSFGCPCNVIAQGFDSLELFSVASDPATSLSVDSSLYVLPPVRGPLFGKSGFA